MTEIKAYKCDYCKKYYMSKSAASRHEKKCFHNPETKSCLTCGNFLTVYETVFIPPYDGDPGSSDYDEEVNSCHYSKKNSWKEKFEFQTKCNHWIPIKCSRKCDFCEIECVLDE